MLDYSGCMFPWSSGKIRAHIVCAPCDKFKQGGGKMKTKIWLCGVVFIVVVFLISVAVAGEWVKFEGKTMAGDKLELTGILSKPNGNGPFPAVVMLCGCGGLKNKDDAKNQEVWAQRLMGWGYITLSVDSLTPRNYDNVCENG
jgi:hypothetical protein